MPSGCDRNGNGLAFASVAASDTDDMYDDGSGGPNEVGGFSSSSFGGLVAYERGAVARTAMLSTRRGRTGPGRTQVRSMVESIQSEIGPFLGHINLFTLPISMLAGRQHTAETKAIRVHREHHTHPRPNVLIHTSWQPAVDIVHRSCSCHVVMEGGLRDTLRRTPRVVCYNQGNRESCPNRITTSLSNCF